MKVLVLGFLAGIATWFVCHLFEDATDVKVPIIVMTMLGGCAGFFLVQWVNP